MEAFKKQQIASYSSRVLAILLVAIIFAAIFPSFKPNSSDFYLALTIYSLVLVTLLLCIFQNRFRLVKLLGWLLIFFIFSFVWV
ncbi:hypothetical protein N483_18520 [Pseudoalteromonas luteoviolacea NCIMB 1944]|uniref:Uncharacterized protein n=1 Tax=Pseudoalteromonas luteoviolacea (strain 2ta16) TaxID=1353533 RepID=V4HP37_PSEL2|nr:hypothetical protein PL2TA16_00337 [Pseudoalteromonas luteoviolacea 2ta16]KZN40185.1 hypothetical protein N483_18520 [Pseudoalteromonas luteoviolacea NCIMB 1944]